MNPVTTVRFLDKELLASGTFHTLGVGTTTLRVEAEGEAVEFEFVVSTAEGKGANQFWAQVVSSDRLQVHLVNLRQMLPPMTIGPVELGTLANRPMTFIAEALGVKGSDAKHITYSIYLGGRGGKSSG